MQAELGNPSPPIISIRIDGASIPKPIKSSNRWKLNLIDEFIEKGE
jgi:hypothetical protein